MQDKPLIARNLTVLLGYIFFTGIVHLNSYFLEFGFRISNLNLEYYHILFRGLSVNFTNFYAFFIFLFISISIVLNFDGYRIKVKQAKIKISHIQEFSIIICFILIYVIASLDGFYVAQRDSTLSTTTLRELVSLKSSSDELMETFDNLSKAHLGEKSKILIVHKSGNHLTVISPVAFAEVGDARPSVHTFNLKSGDTYAETPSFNVDNFWRSLF